jgi:hypothetical protein
VISNDDNQLARTLRHDGIRLGEIIAYRAWLVIEANWFRRGDGLLHSVFVRDYVWHPDRPASGDVRTHGIYSFRDPVRCRWDYGYTQGGRGTLLFGKVKIWGEVIEHRAGYRSEFGKIASLDYGDQELLERFCTVYRLNQQ